MYKQLERYRKISGRIRVAKYARCSSDEQRKNGYTISDQLDLLDDFCAEYELIGSGEYVDEGVSATLEINKRKALAQLIQDAKAGKFDIVVFKCIDRFFRNVGEYYECQKQLRKAGVTWISIEESDLDPEDDDAAFKINIYLTMAEYEAKKTSKRIRFNNKMRIKNRQVVTGAQSFAFCWTVAGEKKNKYLVKDEEKAHILYDLLEHYEMHQSKAGTLEYIYKKYSMDMTMRSLGNLLTNTLLYGEYKGIENYVEPYITKERFDRLQDTLKRNARHSETPNREFIFSGLIKCPNCGCVLVGNYTRNKKNGGSGTFSYRCNKNRQGRRCSFNKSTSERKIEKQLLENLSQYVNDEILKIERIEEKAAIKTDNSARIEKIKKEMDRLNTMFRKDRIDEAEYDKEYISLQRELRSLDVEEKPIKRNLDAIKKILETDYKTIYNKLDKPHKKAFWRGIIKEFSIDEDKKIIPESIIFF